MEKNGENLLDRTILTWALFLMVLAFPGMAMADGIAGFMDFSYITFDTRTKDVNGVETRSDQDSFIQKYHLTLDRSFYPNLRFEGGGIFERTFTTLRSDMEKRKFSFNRLQPFAGFFLRTPMYKASGRYEKREERSIQTGSGTTTEVQEVYETTGGWRPDGFPSVDVQYTSTRSFDRQKAGRDLLENRIFVNSIYTPFNGMTLNYQGRFVDADNRLDLVNTDDEGHTLSYDFQKIYFGNRLFLASDYTFTYQEVTVKAERGGNVDFPLFPLSGLSSTDDTPDSGALTINPALVDGATAVNAGVDLGRVLPGGDSQDRNIGIEFVNKEEVNRLLLSTDRDLPDDVANSFSWQVYVSDDNDIWTLHTTVFPAPFGPFLNRFVITFPNVTTRYIKVVTMPLSTSVPGASVFPNIFVTELQAFIQKPAAEVEGTTRRTVHVFNFGSRLKLMETPGLFYELSGFYNGTGDSPDEHTISNGLFLFHDLSEKVKVSGRIAREDGKEEEGQRAAYLYTASLVAKPLITTRHTLNFSGISEKIAGKTSNRNGVTIRNYFEIYRGVELNLNGGYSTQKGREGENSDRVNYSTGLSLTPHKALSFTFAYRYEDVVSRDSAVEKDTEITKTGTGTISYSPYSRLHLFFSLDWLEEEGKSRTLRDFVLNWSPFSDGDIEVNVSYNETFSTETEGKSRQLIPFVRWNINRNTYMDLSYQYLTSNDLLGESETNVVNVNFHVNI